MIAVSLRPPADLRSGAEVRWELEVPNRGADAVRLEFRTSQRGDVVLEREGREAYRWSEGRMFLQVLGERSIEPGESWMLTLEGLLEVEPGDYEAVGTVACTPPLSPARIDVVVVLGRDRSARS